MLARKLAEAVSCMELKLGNLTTEKRNQASLKIDTLSTAEVVA